MSTEAITLYYGQREEADHRVSMVEVDTAIEYRETTGMWHGELWFICFDAITDNQAFRHAIEFMVTSQNFGGRMMGGPVKPTLTGLAIRRRDKFTAEEHEMFGNEVRAIIRVEYTTVRDWAEGHMVEQADGVYYPHYGGRKDV